MDHFKSGKHDGKFGAFDDKGVPTQTADGTEIPEKKLKALKKEYDSVKDKWTNISRPWLSIARI